MATTWPLGVTISAKIAVRADAAAGVIDALPRLQIEVGDPAS